MVERWNSVVSKNDRVYHLGDCVINRKSLSIFDRLNGSKVLIKGNHDIFNLSDYTKYFRDIRGYHVYERYLLSHIPVHPDSIERFKGNIHGHLHYRRVMDGDRVDPRYFCVCVEHTDYTPISFDAVVVKFQKYKIHHHEMMMSEHIHLLLDGTGLDIDRCSDLFLKKFPGEQSFFDSTVAEYLGNG
jgi:calcineurin-like phosphoesterase family protein